MNILTLIIFLPLIFGLLIAVLPSTMRESFKYITLGATLLQLCMAIWLYIHFKTGAAYGGIIHEDQFQFVQKRAWIDLNLMSLGKLQAQYFVGIDGISVGLLVMSSIIMVVAAVSSWEIKTNLKGF